MSENSDLPALERIQRYLDCADDARKEAKTCKDSLRQSYLLMAEHWELLAAEAAKQLGAGNGNDFPPPDRPSGRIEWLRRVK